MGLSIGKLASRPVAGGSCRWAGYMQGYDVEIASDAVWSSKTTAQFSTYQAIVFGDGRFTDATAQGMTPPGHRLKFNRLMTVAHDVPEVTFHWFLTLHASPTSALYDAGYAVGVNTQAAWGPAVTGATCRCSCSDVLSACALSIKTTPSPSLDHIRSLPDACDTL